MKTIRTLTLLCIIQSFAAVTVNAQTISTKDLDIPWTVSIPCVPELASGTINLHSTVFFDRFGFYVRTFANPQGGSLIGDVTGRIYRPAGMTKTFMSSTILNGALVETYINNYRFVGQGGIRVSVHSLLHVTTNANGVVTAYIEFTDSDCK